MFVNAFESYHLVGAGYVYVPVSPSPTCYLQELISFLPSNITPHPQYPQNPTPLRTAFVFLIFRKPLSSEELQQDSICDMYSVVPAVKKLKARRAHVKELRRREDELKTSYQKSKEIDDLYNKPQSQTPRTHNTEQNTYADKTQELRASTSQAVEIERPV